MFAIITQCYEDYGYRVKAKGGREIVVESDDLRDAEAVAELIADEFEHILDIVSVEPGFESDFVKSQREYNPEDTIYLDPVVRKGKNGDFYLKRGYQVSQWVGDGYEHLRGKFYGYVDNLNTGECVCRIEDTQKFALEPETV